MRGVRQITANLYQISVGGPSAFLVVEDKITVIDAGRWRSGPRILECIGNLGRSPEEISHIVSTHYHLDHIGGIAHLQAASLGRVAVHRSEVPFVQGEKPLPSPFRNPLLACYQEEASKSGSGSR